jgi:hypothetical protein
VALDLFAGIRVSEYAAARLWYERLLGGEPTFLAHETEAVWELDEHRHLFSGEDAENPGGEVAEIRHDHGPRLTATSRAGVGDPT